jgi:hypothetical protein
MSELELLGRPNNRASYDTAGVQGYDEQNKRKELMRQLRLQAVSWHMYHALHSLKMMMGDEGTVEALPKL